MIDVAGGNPRALTPEGYRLIPRTVSPDDKRVAVIGPDRKRYLYPSRAANRSRSPAWRPRKPRPDGRCDGRFLYVFRRRDIPVQISKLDVATGKKESWKELMPGDGAGIVDIAPIIPTLTARNTCTATRARYPTSTSSKG